VIQRLRVREREREREKERQRSLNNLDVRNDRSPELVKARQVRQPVCYSTSQEKPPLKEGYRLFNPEKSNVLAREI